MQQFSRLWTGDMNHFPQLHSVDWSVDWCKWTVYRTYFDISINPFPDCTCECVCTEGNPRLNRFRSHKHQVRNRSCFWCLWSIRLVQLWLLFPWPRPRPAAGVWRPSVLVPRATRHDCHAVSRCVTQQLAIDHQRSHNSQDVATSAATRRWVSSGLNKTIQALIHCIRSSVTRTDTDLHFPTKCGCVKCQLLVRLNYWKQIISNWTWNY